MIKHSYGQQTIRIRLKAYDHTLIDEAVRRIVDTALRTGARLKGPIPLRTKIKHLTVSIAPHADGKSRERYEQRFHRRILDIVDSTDKTIDALMKLILGAGVEVQIRLFEDKN